MLNHGIVNLPDLLNSLSDDQRERANRIFHVTLSTGDMQVPEPMKPWVESRFGSVEAAEHQQIVKVTNLVTLEGALFNETRANRPFEVKDNENVSDLIAKSVGDPFCTPATGTPEDVFGRVEGKSCVTASNVAKYDGFHGLVIFANHDPLIWSEAEVVDYFRTARTWAEKAHEEDPTAVYFFLMWNCLWKSGASIVHGHMQMTVSQGMHYAKIESWRRAALDYRQQYGANYFDDLWQVHQDLGLAWQEEQVRGLAYLTPIKEKEVLLLGQSFNDELASALYSVIETMVTQMGVRAFNMAVYLPPIAPVPEDWEGFPVVVRIVDRGDVDNRVSDIGAMELYASSVVCSDPFVVASILKGWKAVPDGTMTCDGVRQR